MKNKNYEKLLQLSLNLGKKMIQCGCEIWRAEDTMTRVLNSYGISDVQVFGTTAQLLCTVVLKDNTSYTRSSRILQVSNNLDALERLNKLSRDVCSNLISLDELEVKIAEVKTSKEMNAYNCIGYFFSTFGFSLFFGGTFSDGMVAGLIALFVFMVEKQIASKDINPLVYTFLMNIIASSLAVIMVRAGLAANLDKIIMGMIMLFIPTLGLINGIKDMFNRDINTGIFRVVESFLISGATAFGSAVALVLMGVIL